MRRLFALLLLLAATLGPSPAALAERPPAGGGFAEIEKTLESAREAMMGSPQEAHAAATRAVEVADALPPSRKAAELQASAKWLYGEALIYMNRASDARPVIEDALAKAEKAAPDTKLHGDLLRSRGALSAGEGKMLAALQDYQRAYRVFRAAGVDRSMAIALQDIGLIYVEAKDFGKALHYFDQSAEAFSDDPILTLTMHNNRAEVLRMQGRHEEASREYEAALANARELGSDMLIARILTNLAMSRTDEGDLAGAAANIRQAERLSAGEEAAGWRPFVFGVSAKIALERGQLGLASDRIGQTFAGQDIEATDMLFREYHQIAARIYERVGRTDLALAHFKAFQRLDTEAQESTSSTASQLMGARFDFANQNLKIANLEKGQLERDIQIERQKATLRNWLLIAGAVVLAALLFGLISAIRSRNKVRAANAELSVTNVELEKALKAKTEFLATTSHEIRTPLNGILGMTQVLLSDRELVGQTRERIEVVHGAGQNLRALVDDILDIAKIESGELTVVSEPVDLAPILKDARGLWSGEAETKGLTLEVALDEAPARVTTDGGRLRQIIFNLMSNAIKFTPTGSVTLAARQVPGGGVAIDVRDTGIGIPADMLEAIFEPFRQVEGGMTRQFGGTGLGLAICRQLTEALGGTLEVTSEEGKGSTFTVVLPHIDASAGANSVDSDDEPNGMACADVLLVDSNERSAGMLAMMLRAQVRSLDALDRLDDVGSHLDGRTHLVIGSDFADQDFDALRETIRLAQKHNVRVALLHSAKSATTIAQVMMLGADQLILKPIGAPEFVAAFATLCSDQPRAFVSSGTPDEIAA